MAFSTSSYFNNAVVGQMQAGADVDIYRINDTPEYAVGQGFTRSDGAKFRYAHAGTAVNRGILLAQDFSGSSTVDTDNAVIAPASAVAVANETIKPGAINSRYLQMTLASISADQLAGGYISITDGIGIGYTYRIKGNTATDTPASGDIRIQLYDKLQVALTATTDVAITGSMYANLLAAGTGTDGLTVGVSCASLTATDPFGWIQTAGVAAVLCDTAGSAGNMAIVSQAVAGSYQPMYVTTAAGNYPVIGYIITPGDSAGEGVIMLQLE
jgi:hypothetical protein